MAWATARNGADLKWAPASRLGVPAREKSKLRPRGRAKHTLGQKKRAAPEGGLQRILLYTGKGGVGKTTTAAATGLHVAAKGKRTLVMSTDSAHSLGDAYDQELTGEPTRVEENLYALEIDLQHEIETHWKEVEAYLVSFFEAQGLDAITAKELAYIPGFELLAGLFEVQHIHRERKFDVLILDTAPTADTLRLLSIPDALDWYYRRFFKTFRRAVKVGRGTVGRVMSIPFPTDTVVDTIGMLHERVRDVNAILTDPKLTSVRIVVNPEKMVIKEAQRTLSYLCLFGFYVDEVVVNKVLPDEVSDPYFKKMKADQVAYLKTIDQEFFGIPVRLAPVFRREVLGPEALKMYAGALYGAHDPLSFTAVPDPIRVELDSKDEVRVSLHMPFLEAQKFDVYSKGGEVIVRYGNFKRSLLLPYTLAGRQVKSARYADRRLTISFGDKVRHVPPQDAGEEAEGEAAPTKGGEQNGQEIGL
jgi:arsenite/tail-anchored protein-transporting ATPase